MAQILSNVVDNAQTIQAKRSKMKRTVLVIPKEELQKQFATNSRQDVKVVVPDILTDQLSLLLKKRGMLKSETALEGQIWSHAPEPLPNRVCLSSEFSEKNPADAQAPFALSFANERAEQRPHYHRRHIEIYFSEHPLRASFRELAENSVQTVSLAEGGALVFTPDVVHQVALGGLTMVIEIPPLSNDKVDEPL